MRRLSFRLTLPTTLFVVASLVFVVSVGLLAPELSAQVSVSAGGLSGTVTDPQGGLVPNARVTISNKDNGTTQAIDTGSSGTFSLGNLAPGSYVVRVEAKKFKTFESTLPVQA